VYRQDERGERKRKPGGSPRDTERKLVVKVETQKQDFLGRGKFSRKKKVDKNKGTAGKRTTQKRRATLVQDSRHTADGGLAAPVGRRSGKATGPKTATVLKKTPLSQKKKCGVRGMTHSDGGSLFFKKGRKKEQER